MSLPTCPFQEKKMKKIVTKNVAVNALNTGGLPEPP